MKYLIILVFILAGCEKKQTCPTCIREVVMYSDSSNPYYFYYENKDTVMSCNAFDERKDTLIGGHGMIKETVYTCK